VNPQVYKNVNCFHNCSIFRAYPADCTNEEIRNKVGKGREGKGREGKGREGKGREGISSSRRSAVGESDNVIEALKFEGLSGSPKLPKLVTGRCRFLYRILGLESRFQVRSSTRQGELKICDRNKA
jgi:hypothetical protein